MDDVLSVQITHWHGALNKGPHFDLFPSGRPTVNANIQKTEKGTTLSAGNLSATVSSTPHTFDIRFHNKTNTHKLTSLQNRSVGLSYSPATSSPMQTSDMRNINHHILTQSTLSVGEQIYGLGERFGALNKVGQAISLWNADGGTSSEQAYKNIPFWMSNRGYGVFIDAPERVELEVGSERCCRVQTSVEGQRLKWYIIYGPSPKEILDKYTTLTGKPGKVPSWSFGESLLSSLVCLYGIGGILTADIRSLAQHIFHNRIRRRHRSFLPRRHARPLHPPRSLPLRLLLAPRLPLVRFYLLSRPLPRPCLFHFQTQSFRLDEQSLRLDKPLPWSSISCFQGSGGKRISVEEKEWGYLSVGFVAEWDGYCGFY